LSCKLSKRMYYYTRKHCNHFNQCFMQFYIVLIHKLVVSRSFKIARTFRTNELTRLFKPTPHPFFRTASLTKNLIFFRVEVLKIHFENSLLLLKKFAHLLLTTGPCELSRPKKCVKQQSLTHSLVCYYPCIGFMYYVSVLLVEETRSTRRKQPTCRKAHNVVSTTPHHERDSNSQL
jgi:hypothetical protein